MHSRWARGRALALLAAIAATTACSQRWLVADSRHAPSSHRAEQLNETHAQQLRAFADALNSAGLTPASRVDSDTGASEPWNFVSFAEFGSEPVLAVYTADSTTFDTGRTSMVGRAIHGFNDELAAVIKAARSAGLLDHPADFGKLLLAVDYTAADLQFTEASVRKMTSRREEAQFEIPVAIASAFADAKVSADDLITQSSVFINGDLYTVTPDDLAAD